MNSRDLKKIAGAAILLLGGLCAAGRIGLGQEKKQPVSKGELIQLLKQGTGKQLSQGDLAEEVSQRGIAFPADERTLDELRQAGAHSFLLDAIQRAGGTATAPKPHLRPVDPAETKAPAEVLSEEDERKVRAAELAKLPFLEQARYHALEYDEELPNFTVVQTVTRYVQTPKNKDWQLQDKLEIELTYRIKGGEKLKLLRLNGAPSKMTYDDLGGSTSVGEFSSILSALFAPETHAEFKELRHEVFRGRQTVVFDFKVRTAHSQSQITDKNTRQTITSGYQGSVWIEAETKRVLRIEESQVDIPPGFPITLSESAVEYEWVTIADQRYLLPVHAEMLLGQDRERYYTRNVIEFRNYHKFETDLKITSPDDPIKKTPERH
jgi:hypothetical protein